jgi:hypothetical protein
MVMPAPTELGFLSTGAGHVQQAIANIHQPSATSFATSSATNGAITSGAASATGSTLAAGGATTITGP